MLLSFATLNIPAPTAPIAAATGSTTTAAPAAVATIITTSFITTRIITTTPLLLLESLLLLLLIQGLANTTSSSSTFPIAITLPMTNYCYYFPILFLFTITTLALCTATTRFTALGNPRINTPCDPPISIWTWMRIGPFPTAHPPMCSKSKVQSLDSSLYTISF